MGWLQIILWVITHAPQLISLVKQIIELFKSMPKADQMAARAELFDAIKSKDEGKVKGVFKKWKHKCEGVACPADLA